jgi:GNAT superfamily N-acetyltransferase
VPSCSGLTVRPARHEDCAVLGQLRVASITQLCGPDHHGEASVIAQWAGDGSADKFLRLIGQPDSTLLVAERGGALVGLGARTGALVTLNYVHPAHRFSGISKAIMTALEEDMARAGITLARLNSTVTALAFYEARGWMRDGDRQADGSVPMRKAL